MKRFAAILLMGLLLFNWYGYQLFYNYAQQQSDLRMEALMDQNRYNQEELVMLKIPLHLPYISDQGTFQRVDGAITLQGIEYKYVKRKVSQDTLYLMCLPDQEKMKLTTAKNDYFKTVADIQHNGKSKEGNRSIKVPFIELYFERQVWKVPEPAVYSPLFTFSNQNMHCAPEMDGPVKPPEERMS